MNHLTIVGAGLHEEQLTLGAIRALQSGASIALRTEHCGCADWLRTQGIAFFVLDELHEQAEDFAQLNDMIEQRIMQLLDAGDLIYCVADVRDVSVPSLLECYPDAQIIAGVPLEGALHAIAQGPSMHLAASDYDAFQPESDCGTLIREIDTRQIASELKLRLMERYPEEEPIKLLEPSGAMREIPLCELDQQPGEAYNHMLCAYVPQVTEITDLQRFGFDQLNRIMRRLRGPNGCPWDIKQTHESLTSNVVEEAYEVVDAIQRGDIDSLYDELGDLLLQVTLHAEIARQHGEFTIDDVTSTICQKMISRHVHIFGKETATTAEDALQLWENVKKKERNLSSTTGTMRAVTKSLPALMRAEKVQKKAASVGFDWDEAILALDKVYEEADEVKQAITDGGYEEELGDLLFAVVNVSRLLKVQPELALMRAIDKFVARFDAMEQLILRDERQLEGMSLAEMDEYWGLVKQNCVKQ
ncbi:nucleoside triphosphate pyrophosphohydrolase [Eubacteriales bacterium OttesenSCG-928-N13]|nr:nucleoside triphosphate pyrophosphohydrolase [Eubacteriales bacterium OttesenSCG-928-N13]